MKKDKEKQTLENNDDQLIIKNSDVEKLEATDAFNHLCACRDLPSEMSFPLKVAKPAFEQLFQAYRQQKMEIIEKYGDRNDKNELINPAPNAFRFTTRAAEFQKEYIKFLQLETKITFKKFTIVLKEDVPDKYFSTNDQEALECLVEFKMKGK